jgi:hypothetical protein
MNLQSLPRGALRRKLVALGIPASRHRMKDLMSLLPVKLDGKPYEDFDADMVAEVLVYLIGKNLISVTAEADGGSQSLAGMEARGSPHESMKRGSKVHRAG